MRNELQAFDGTASAEQGKVKSWSEGSWATENTRKITILYCNSPILCQLVESEVNGLFKVVGKSFRGKAQSQALPQNAIFKNGFPSGTEYSLEAVAECIFNRAFRLNRLDFEESNLLIKKAEESLGEVIIFRPLSLFLSALICYTSARQFKFITRRKL